MRTPEQDDEAHEEQLRAEIKKEVIKDLEKKFFKALMETINFILQANDQELALQGVSYALKTKDSKKMSMTLKAEELKKSRSVLGRYVVSYRKILAALNNDEDSAEFTLTLSELMAKHIELDYEL